MEDDYMAKKAKEYNEEVIYFML